MTWHFDWPSFIVGVITTWAGSVAIALLIARDRPRPARGVEQLPAIPRWAAERRDAALETELDPLDVELQRLIDGEPAA